MLMNDVYVAEIQSIFPRKYSAKYMADRLYPSHLYGDNLNRFAQKLVHQFGIKYRTSVIDWEIYPTVALADSADHPKLWGKEIINKLTKNINKNNIGLFNLSYNITNNTDILPNLATQIVIDAKLPNLDKNDEIAYYGCAAAIYSINEAVNYCKASGKAAIVFVFDQCSTMFRQLDKDDQDFKKMLVSNLLFTDAGVGILLIPEKMRNAYQKPLLKIIDIETKYTPGNLIYMKNGRFLMSSRLKDIMPKLVSDELINPFLAKKQLDIDNIDEWSIHQGGSELIKQFCKKDCLNLSDNQINRSMKLFYKYGNTSSASCLLVLESFFNEKNTLKTPGSKGIICGFGAGYYLGLALYEWDL
jgi:predicted naringenin-chalcone synthase